VIELVIPDPSLVVLIGAAGAGKSTFAVRHFEPEDILSSDAYRVSIAGDESDQRATGSAFKQLHLALEGRLAKRRLTVVDATNVERSARRALLSRAAAADVPAIAIVLDLPPATILARNAGRTARIVDEPVVRRHLARLRDSLDGLAPVIDGEGFQRVIVIRDPRDLDAVRVSRRRG
jgi:protein phosphatase